MGAHAEQGSDRPGDDRPGSRGWVRASVDGHGRRLGWRIPRCRGSLPIPAGEVAGLLIDARRWLIPGGEPDVCTCRRLPGRRVGRVMIALEESGRLVVVGFGGSAGSAATPTPVAAGGPIDVAPSGGGLSEGVRDVADGAPGGGAAGRELPDGLVAAAVRGDGRARG